MNSIPIHRLKMIIVALFIPIGFFCQMETAQARLPEPDHIIYGINATDASEVSLVINDEVIQTYTMGSTLDADMYYILRIPMDSMDPQTPGTARTGDIAMIYMDGAPSDAGTVVIGEKGAVQRIDLTTGGNWDSDNDGMRDTWELEFFQTLNRTGTEDFDSDTYSDLEEYEAGTDPTSAESYPVQLPSLTIKLNKGFNLVSLPVDPAEEPDLLQLLNQIGNASEIEKVLPYNREKEIYFSIIPESSENETYLFESGEGVVVYALQEKEIEIANPPCLSTELFQGVNLVGFTCMPESYTAFQLLEDLTQFNIASIQRYDSKSGKFQTATFEESGMMLGIDFPILMGEGYFVQMKQDVTGFQP